MSSPYLNFNPAIVTGVSIVDIFSNVTALSLKCDCTKSLV